MISLPEKISRLRKWLLSSEKINCPDDVTDDECSGGICEEIFGDPSRGCPCHLYGDERVLETALKWLETQESEK